MRWSGGFAPRARGIYSWWPCVALASSAAFALADASYGPGCRNRPALWTPVRRRTEIVAACGAKSVYPAAQASADDLKDDPACRQQDGDEGKDVKRSMPINERRIGGRLVGYNVTRCVRLDEGKIRHYVVQEGLVGPS